MTEVTNIVLSYMLVIALCSLFFTLGTLHYFLHVFSSKSNMFLYALYYLIYINYGNYSITNLPFKFVW